MLKIDLQPISLPVISYAPDDLRAMAMEGIESERARLARGLNLNDQPAKPLNAVYKATKLARGLPGIRDMRFTGALLNSRGITEMTGDSVTVDYSNPREDAIAQANDAIEPMAGLSPNDVDNVSRESEKRFNLKFS